MVQATQAIESHVYAGCTFPGRQNVGAILTELERQKAARKDVVVDTAQLQLRVIDGQLLLNVPRRNHPAELVPLTHRAHTQLAQRLGLPMRSRLYNWLVRGKQTVNAKEDHDRKQNWPTWTNLVNDYFQKNSLPVMVRMMDDDKGNTYCRALLSNKYKVVSNADFFYSIVERLKDVNAEIWHARLSEDKFYGYAVAPHVSGEVSTDRSFDPGDGWKSRWYGKEGDVLNAALAFGNSETGEGGVFLSNAIIRRVCENYCVWHDIVAHTHIGQRQSTDTMLSDETIMKQNELFFLKIRDYVHGSFDKDTFQEMLDTLSKAAQDEVQDPEAAADALQVVYDLGEERKAAIRNSFIREGDNSRYGLINAVTRHAHEGESDPDKGFDLEKLAKDLAYSDMGAIYKRAASAQKSKIQKLETAGV